MIGVINFTVRLWLERGNSCCGTVAATLGMGTTNNRGWQAEVPSVPVIDRNSPTTPAISGASPYSGVQGRPEFMPAGRAWRDGMFDPRRLVISGVAARHRSFRSDRPPVWPHEN